MSQFSRHREQVESTINQLRELINKLQILEDEYLRQEEKLFVISEFANDWEYWQAPDGHYKYVSPSCKVVTGYKPQEFYDDPALLKKIIAFDNWEKWKAHNHSMAKNGLVNPIEFKIHTKEGKSRWIHHICQTVTGRNGENLGVRGSNRDITELKKLQEKLKHMAGHDLLTGLPNRSLFLEHLKQTIKEAKRNGRMFAVVFIDLDDFKEINDTHGHEAGDTVLKKLAQELTGVTRENDIVARLGGDEFVGLFDVSHDADVGIIRRKIFDDVHNEIHCPTYNITIHYSFGVSIYPTDGTSVDTLLKKADLAMYLQKENNKAERKKNK
ncbi:PAS domain S-box/diguanylate cyclase (GGDEF) domain-containing protein [Desulfocapsa sulfexigens DSM 10523]|uniref:PAS domain S-box/diguanylate cyclase (GGDEF) domain-containing protein n=1 Tax=Desulfocapsa sulfexigens (strain DSM 10523 / SB164P1) TaxID=1167006 RepID=M1PJJ1_DESSD|nr:sensor domain-containing diguanylate cyclase [Desulfocapsa sulfexigens]AGF79730.1 PAS domain S-box/diguanylate cyclase (GGDEF) domain-containing protein [Desulfocapsa sulfexigens DSM 10523]